MNIPSITAHSGCEGTAQDSLASVECGLTLGADIIEMDVRMDDTGTLRISHNAEPSREAYTAHATLQQVFDILRPTAAAINLDIKEGQHISAILDLAAKNGFKKERLILSGSISLGQMYQNSEWGKRAQIFLNLEEILKYAIFPSVQSSADFQSLMETPWKFIRPRLGPYADYVPVMLHVCKSLAVVGCNCPQWFLTEAVCTALDGKKLSLSVWTVDDAKEQRRLFNDSRLSLVNLTTRNVSSAVYERKALYGI